MKRFGKYRICSTRSNKPPMMPGCSTIVQFLAIEKLSMSEREKKRPDTPRIIKNI